MKKNDSKESKKNTEESKKTTQTNQQETKTNNSTTEQSSQSSLEDDFAEFEKSTTNFKPNENSQSSTEIPKNTDNSSNSNSSNTNNNPYVLTVEDSIRLRMFLGFVCFLLSGFNTFLFNMIFKGNVKFTQMKLDEEERNDILPYLNTPRIIDFIRKFPPEVLAIAHIELMFYDKYSTAMEENKKEKLRLQSMTFNDTKEKEEKE